MQFETKFTERKRITKEFKKDSKCRKDQYEDTDIYRVLEKYTNSGIVPKFKNAEPMYIDTTCLPTNLKEALELKEDMKNYFKNMTAQSRKTFGDSFDEFYETFKSNDWTKFNNANILTKEQTNELQNTIDNKNNEIKDLIYKQAEEKYTKIINDLKGGLSNGSETV